MEKSIFVLLVDALAYERLDGIILQNPDYEFTVEEIDRMAEELKTMDLSVGEIRAVNKLICAYLMQNEVYSRFAYEQGFRDCAELLKDIGVVGRNRHEG